MVRSRGLITYREFVQRVRRHRPSDLLPALAATAIQFRDLEAWKADRVRLPWALAAAAKACIVAGNEDRPAGVTERDVIEVCAAYNALEDLWPQAVDATASLNASDGDFQPSVCRG
ncbi:MAG TPA: hypothetical protein VKR22_07010, partial [Acidimicrobiales bacterium]|nr:hypothetical protein [Acidimicrobiales bacterium]